MNGKDFFKDRNNWYFLANLLIFIKYTETSFSELRNEREKREDEKESFSSVNPRVGKANKKGTKKKLGNLSLQTIALKGKDVHKTLTFLAAKGWE